MLCERKISFKTRSLRYVKYIEKKKQKKKHTNWNILTSPKSQNFLSAMRANIQPSSKIISIYASRATDPELMIL